MSTANNVRGVQAHDRKNHAELRDGLGDNDNKDPANQKTLSHAFRFRLQDLKSRAQHDDDNLTERPCRVSGDPAHSERLARWVEELPGVQINHLNLKSPPLAEIRDEFTVTVDLLTQLGFDGTWSLEFVDGTLGESGNEPERLVAAVAGLGVLREIPG